MVLNQDQLAVLAHIVIDPQAWADHAAATVGEQAVLDKVERWRAEYLAESAKPGYQTRAQRETAV